MNKEKYIYLSFIGYLTCFGLGVVTNITGINMIQQDFDKVVDQNIAETNANERLRNVIDLQRSVPVELIYHNAEPNEYSDIRQIITSENRLIEFMKVKNLTEIIAPSELHRLSVINNVDPGFVLATMIWETGWGDSDAWVNGNNPAGIRCGQEYCTYPSPESGIKAEIELLRIYTQGSDPVIGIRRTPKEIRERWSEAADSQEVTAIWQLIVGGK